MFNISPLNSLPENVTLLLKGAQLAYWDIPQVFSLISEINKDPFYISMTFSKSKELKEPKLDIGIITGNRLDIKVINPHDALPTASKTRIPLLNTKNPSIQLTYSMLILSPHDCDHVLFYYEFYEEPFEEEKQDTNQKECAGGRP